MFTFWALVRTNDVGFIKVTIQADNQFIAQNMLKGMYGDKLLTEAAYGGR